MNQIGRLDVPSEPECPPGGPPVAVIGAGFSGIMTAIHLAAALPPDRQILLCETGTPGRGAAYSTTSAAHLLNVRAANMSAFPRQPDHFERWLAARPADALGEVHRTQAGQFASRGLYGCYLSSLLDAAVAGHPGRLRIECGEVTDLVPEDGRYRVVFADGHAVPAAGAVLAAGNLAPPEAGSPLYRSNPWAPGTLDGLRPDVPLLILGTGLTMVDLAVDLRRSGFPGPVIALSRRGLTPHWHAGTQSWPTPNFKPAERASVLRLLVRVRQEVQSAAQLGLDWRSVVDSLRPVTAELWQGLDLTERRRFLRHLRPYWDVHRHRLAGPVADELGVMLASGFLTIRRGRVAGIARQDDLACVTIRPRGSDAIERLMVQRVIDATGLRGAGAAASPLIANLRRRGLMRLDALEAGLDVTGNLEVLGASGAVTPNLWALGPIVRGVFWECIAVPDIRVQADSLARQIARTAALA